MHNFILVFIAVVVLAFAGCGHTGSSWPEQPVIYNGAYTAGFSGMEVDVSNATAKGAHFDVPSLGISTDLTPGQPVEANGHMVMLDSAAMGPVEQHTLTIDGTRYPLGNAG